MIPGIGFPNMVLGRSSGQFRGQKMLTDRSSPVLIKMALLFDLCLPLCLSEGFDYFEPQYVYRLLS